MAEFSVGDISLEMSKSSRALCREQPCREKIGKDVPRWAESVVAEIAGYGREMPTLHYRHIPCGLLQPRYKALFGNDKGKVDDLADRIPGFASLPRSSQDWVCDCAEEALGGQAAPEWPGLAQARAEAEEAEEAAASGKKPKKRSKKAAPLTDPVLVVGSREGPRPRQPATKTVKDAGKKKIAAPGDELVIERAPPPPPQWLASVEGMAPEDVKPFGAACRECGEVILAGDVRITYVHFTASDTKTKKPWVVPHRRKAIRRSRTPSLTLQMLAAPLLHRLHPVCFGKRIAAGKEGERDPSRLPGWSRLSPAEKEEVRGALGTQAKAKAESRGEGEAEAEAEAEKDEEDAEARPIKRKRVQAAEPAKEEQSVAATPAKAKAKKGKGKAKKGTIKAKGKGKAAATATA